ncbi:MAG TPA: POTRA domain-containing protein, partial [Alphaproteobacteria bacterium]|nr:POTRA domain-containing protein [Alphaproteobacteria bacterium]
MSAGVRGVWLRARALIAAMVCIAVLAPPAFSAGNAVPPPPSAGAVEAVPAETEQPTDQTSGGQVTGLGTNLIQPGGPIHQIRVVGTQRIEPETVLSYLAVQPGDPFDPVTADLSLKRLWATGLFADVVMRRESDDLVVQVVENPIINRIVFEGNHSKDDKKLG